MGQRRRRRRSQLRQLRCGFHLFSGFQHFLDGALHIKGLLGDIVVLAFDDGFEAFYRVSDLDVASLRAGELLGNVEWLRQEALNLCGHAPRSASDLR